jgi:RimJ/RimL family protein N-acetyltransferase
MRYIIKGITQTGDVFRPSDWADRLCSVLSLFVPNNKPRPVNGTNVVIFSTLVMPTLIDGVRSVIVDKKLNNLEPLALDFALSFARDNNLVVEYEGINTGMITTRFLSHKEYHWYADWIKEQDEDTLRLFFGLPVSEYYIDNLVSGFVKDPEKHHFLVAERNGIWLGTVHIATVSDTDIEFGIIVNYANRNQGIADTMMKEAIQWATHRRYTRLYMHCLSWNKPIRHLCEKYGLEVKNFTDGREVDSVCKLPPLIVTSGVGKDFSMKNHNLYRLILQNEQEMFSGT